jgi:hypothetical protein
LNLNISSNDRINKIVKISLLGSVKNPVMVLQLQPALNFGKVVKDSSKTINIGIKNTGEFYLQIDSLKFSGQNASEFSVGSRNYPIRIDPEETDNISIIFTPKSIGAKSAKLIIYCNDLFSYTEVDISGEGILGTGQTLGIVKVGEIPKEYSLSHNYPNPFNPSTRFEYGLPNSAFVTIKIYNYLGQEVETLINEQQAPGYYIFEWHPNNLPSGAYFFRLIANSTDPSNTTKYIQLRKILYVR